MDVRLTPAMRASPQQALPTGVPAARAANGTAPGGGPAGASFAAALGEALQGVSQSQKASGDMQRRFQSGVDGASLEETMIALQKAQLGFQAALAVRNRLVSAYTDIMDMPV